MTSSLLTVAVAIVLQAATPPATRPAPQTARPGSIQLVVSAAVGSRLSAATVRADGATMRQGTTGADGTVTLLNLPPGTYRCRIEHDGYLTLEKEIVVRAGARTQSEAVLTVAPTPPPPPPSPPAPVAPPPAASAPLHPPGEPSVTSLADLAEQLVRDPAPISERALGCSGATAAKLISVRDSLAAHTHTDGDEMLYIVAGEATLKIGERTHTVGPAWLGVIPRGQLHTLTRRGRTSHVVVLSIVSGPACAR